MSCLDKNCLAQTSPGQNGFFEDTLNLNQLQHNQDLSAELDYLEKLTRQRQRIQDLSKLYQQKDQQVKKLNKKLEKLQRENILLQQFTPFKSMYEDLMRDYNLLAKKYQTSEHQNKDLRLELTHKINQNSQFISHAKGQIKKLQNQKEQKISNLTDGFTNIESQYTEIIAQFKNKQIDFKSQIQQLQNQLEREKKQYEKKISKIQRSLEVTVNHLKNSESQNLQLEQHIDECSKNNISLRDQFNRKLQQMQENQSELKYQLQRLTHQINNLRRQNKEKDFSINILNENLKRLNQRLASQQKKNQEAEFMLSKTHETFELKLRDLNQMANCQQITSEKINYQLKQSIEDLINAKNQLILENRKLKQTICRKEIAQRKRKNLLNSQLKQINKMETAVKRIF